MAEKVLKVTYSYDGKIMPVKELQLNDSKLIQPRINIEDGASRSARGINSSMTSRTISTRQTKSRFDPKKTLVVQFEENLEAIYDAQAERVAKDNDSNYSAESFERHKRQDEDNAKRKSINKQVSQLTTTKSHLSGKLSKVSAMRRTQNSEAPSEVPEPVVSKKKIVKIRGEFISDQPDRFLNDPLKQVTLTPGILMTD